jgi:hypothetical protein
MDQLALRAREAAAVDFVLGLVTVEANCSQQSAIRLHRGMNAASALISHGGGAMEPDSNRSCSGSGNRQDLERD